VEHLVHSHSEQVADVDLVCGMKVDPAKSPHRYTHGGRSYFFCSAGCRNKFIADPGKYLSKAGADQPPSTPVPEGTIYTCPMHPEVRQIGPGACPICGMALEPEAGGEHDGGELADMSRRLWISAVLALPVVVLEMDGHFGFAPLSHDGSSLVQLALVTPVVLWGGWPFFVRGAQSLRAISTCSRLSPWARGSRTPTASSPRSLRDFSPRHSAPRMVALRFILKLPPSLPCLCWSARCWNCGPEPRPPPRSAP
jgi:YHS domain-containing protein